MTHCPTSSPQTVGVIVRLEKEEFKVLTQHGKVRGRALVGGVGVCKGVGLAWCTAVAHT